MREQVSGADFWRFLSFFERVFLLECWETIFDDCELIVTSKFWKIKNLRRGSLN